MRNILNYTIMDRQGLLTAAFTAATTDIITSNTHGLKNGDKVRVSSTTTLPAGLAASTTYWVIEATTNTFKLSPVSVSNYTSGLGRTDFTVVDITDTGTGTHTFLMHDIGKNVLVEDFRHIALSLDGLASANMTVKFQGSIAEDCPDFSATQAYNNAWDYIDVVDSNNGASIDGDTGVAQAGTNDHRMFEANINGLKWFNVIITAWSAGNSTIKAKLFND